MNPLLFWLYLTSKDYEDEDDVGAYEDDDSIIYADWWAVPLGIIIGIIFLVGLYLAINK